jgi:transposase
LKRLREGIRRKRPNKWQNNWFLHHDNGPAHTSLVARQSLTSKNFTVIPLPPTPIHSPDLAPYDFFLFLKMKLRLKGRHFDTTEEIQTQEVIDTFKFENYQGCMNSWETRWDRYIHAQRDHFDGDGGNEALW